MDLARPLRAQEDRTGCRLAGRGKGLFSDTVARITGQPWPCNEGCSPLGNVILLSAEDDISDTIVPRLIASELIWRRVTIIKMMREAGSKERMFSLVTDLNALRRKIIEIGNVKMIVIDPVSAYLGVGKVDSFRATDVRAVSDHSRSSPKNWGGGLGIMHFNKKLDMTNVLLRISDSLAYGAASRHVYAVVNDRTITGDCSSRARITSPDANRRRSPSTSKLARSALTRRRVNNPQAIHRLASRAGRHYCHRSDAGRGGVQITKRTRQCQAIHRSVFEQRAQSIRQRFRRRPKKTVYRQSHLTPRQEPNSNRYQGDGRPNDKGERHGGGIYQARRRTKPCSNGE